MLFSFSMSSVSSVETDQQTIKFWCTCPPGLEELARDEALESLASVGVRSVDASRGRLLCHLESSALSCESEQVDVLQRMLNLRMPANHFLVFYECRPFDRVDTAVADAADSDAKLDKIESLDRLIDLVPKADWKLAMDAWRALFYEPDGRHSQIRFIDHQPLPDYELTRDKPVIDRDGRVKPSTDQDEPVDKSCSPDRVPDRLSFRCTCYRAGSGHSFQSMEAAAAVGAAVQDYFGWNVDLKNFDVEVVLWIEGPIVRLCLSLNRVCMDFRGQLIELGSTALRSTIAAGMIRLCQLQPGDIVCDAMCGSGSIPVEAWTTHPDCWHFAGDCHQIALEKSLTNIQNWCKRWQQRPAVDLVRWDLRKFPLRPATVDVLLADLPFGKRLGSKRENFSLYPAALLSMAKCCVPGTGRACLLSADKTNLSRAVRLLSDYWITTRVVGVSIGGIAASLVLLTRTANRFTALTTGSKPY